MKHYYDEHGRLQFDQNRELLVELAKALPVMEFGVKYSREQWRADIFERASNLVHDYDIHKSLGGLGGCLTLEDWRICDEITDEIQTVLKKMLFDMVDRGFLVNDFVLVAWAAICEIQTYLLFR